MNVQPYSGPCKCCRVHGLLCTSLTCNGSQSSQWRYYTAKKNMSATSIYFESLPYGVHPEMGIIQYEELRKQALIFRPAMILCGTSAYFRSIDFAQFRAIADEVGAILVAHIANISGLAATKQHPSPFDHCVVVQERE